MAVHLRWDGGRVRSQSLARGHHSNWSGLPAGAAATAAPGPNGAVVPARARLSAVPRSTASRRAVSVSACLIGVRGLRAKLWLLAGLSSLRGRCPPAGAYVQPVLSDATRANRGAAGGQLRGPPRLDFGRG